MFGDNLYLEFIFKPSLLILDKILKFQFGVSIIKVIAFHDFHFLTGKIKSCSKEGVHVSLEFFDDILIPGESLQHPSRFDESESVWVWEYPTEVST